MPERRLATFVHISDLHLDDPEPGTGSGEVPELWRLSKWFNGFFGHHYKACTALESIYFDLHEDEDATLLFTDDLTAHGRPTQFELGRDFLGGRAAFRTNRVGLIDPDWRDRAIPGNHDQWPGWPGGPWIWGWPSPELGPTYHDCHRIQDIHLGNVLLRLLSIDTDDQVGPFSPARLLAQGRFEQQLQELNQELEEHGPPGDREVRVLLMHHGPSHRGRLRIGEVLDPSRTALLGLLHQHQVRVVLSGHTHYPRVVREHARAQDGMVRYLDAMCGTTTQRVILPSHWDSERDQRRQDALRPNTLLVHRLVEDEGALWWTAETWVYMPKSSQRFRPTTSHPTLQDQADLSNRIRVWPLEDE